jgi:hypothetical protein
VNPHINLFFFSSRGTVGRPVTHRRGRGWRGGFLGSAVEQYIKLDLNKWLKVLRHLELLPRPMGQDWSQIWLQHFSGTITIWPRSVFSDFWNILTDPTPQRLARMLQVGQQSAFPKIQFIKNRIGIEREIMEGLQQNSPTGGRELSPLLSRRLEMANQQPHQEDPSSLVPRDVQLDERLPERRKRSSQRKSTSASNLLDVPGSPNQNSYPQRRRGSVIEEMKRQSAVFFDDSDTNWEDENRSSDDGAVLADEANGTRLR